jgi:hypothetical protein
VPDYSIKKVIVSKDKLPPISAEYEKYVVRYRIISEDRNRISHWSPQHEISPASIDLESTEAEDRSNISISVAGALLVIRWNTSAWAQEEFLKNPSIELSSYDIYLGWGDNEVATEPVQYYATSSGNYITIPVESGKQSVRVVVQTLTYPRAYSTKVAIADSKVFSLA